MSPSFGSAASILHRCVAERYLMFAPPLHARRWDGPEPPIQIELMPQCAPRTSPDRQAVKIKNSSARAATPARALNA